MEILFLFVFVLIISFPFIQDYILYSNWKDEVKIPNNLEFLEDLGVKKVHQIEGYTLLAEWEKDWDSEWKEEQNYLNKIDKLWNGTTTTNLVFWN